MTQRDFTISFCIVCMNRLHQLQQTLLTNILDNQDYDGLEFILLDYNSQDGMEDWAKENLYDYISSGRLVYYHTPDPIAFNHSHSKNMAFKLASGEIVCNINADHYAGKGFAEYVNSCFKTCSNRVLTTVDYFRTRNEYNPPKDVFGKVCVRKEDFLKVGGFDERMVNYGFEDWDLVNRLELAGMQRHFIDDPAYLKFITHENSERYVLNDNIMAAYVNYISPASSELIVLYTNHEFERGTLLDNSVSGSEHFSFAYTARKHRFENSLKDKVWVRGTWKTDKADLHINFLTTNNTKFKLRKEQEGETLTDSSPPCIYYRLEDPDSLYTISDFNYFYANRSLMETSLEHKTIIQNQAGFGKATVFKNFEKNSLTV